MTIKRKLDAGISGKASRPTSYRQLERRFRRIHLLKSIGHVLRWDGEVMLPSGSGAIRAEQLALLETESNSILRSAKTEHLLDRADAYAMALDDWQRANLREMRRLWQHANGVPNRVVKAFHRATAKADMHWRKAVEAGDFRVLAPHLERVLDAVREKAQALASSLQCAPYDALLSEYDPGRSSVELEAIFGVVASELPTMIDDVLQNQSTRAPLPISDVVPVVRQKDLGKTIMKSLGFPFDKGRLDESLHPFTEGTAEDIRITSRFDRNNFLTGLMGVLHETGHAMYDYGLPAEWATQPVGRDRGMAVHESQALFLEMMIGRDRPFMKFCAPVVASVLNVEGMQWSAENLYKLAIRVRRSFIRMDADEMTYPVHLLVRWELEKELMAGTLEVRNLPAAWREKMRTRLGVEPDSDRHGCLQDSHWPLGYFGYFPSYMTGAVIAAQINRTLREDIPDLDNEIAAGRFRSLFEWLRSRIFEQGARFTGPELLVKATGEEINPRYFLDYLREKYLVRH